MNRYGFLLLLFAAIVPVFASAYADEDDDHHQRASLDAAIKRGEVMKLTEILEKVKGEIQGRIVEIEFEYSREMPIYEIYIINSEGRRLEYEIDARTAEILRLEDED